MVISIILIIFLLFLIKIFKIRLMEPAGIYSIMWIFFIVGSIITLSAKYEFTFGGIIWLIITCYISVISFKMVQSKNKVIMINQVRYPNIPWKLLIGLIILAMGSVLYTMITSGVSFSVFSDFSSLQDTAHTASVNRYASDGQNGSIINQILGTFIYVSPICAGYSLVFAENKKEKLICFSSILPAILSMLLTAAKLAVVTFVILFFVGYYVAYIYSRKKVPYVNPKVFGLCCMGAILLYALFYLSFVLRIGNGESNIGQVITDKLMVYAFGHIQGFDIWFDRYAFDMDKYGLGANTFLAVSSRMGIAEKKQGVYGVISGVCTNVYTQYRGLIEDFSPIFSIVLMIIFFMIVYKIYFYLLKNSKPHIFIQVLYSASLFWIVFNFVSAWAYTTYILAFIVYAFYLYISFHVRFIWGKKEKGNE